MKAPLSLPIPILLSSLSKEFASALESNAPRSPQILSDITSVCTANQGRTSKCEVELDVPPSTLNADGVTSDRPVVFFFHGAGGSIAGFARSSGAHSANVIGVYPQGENGWNTGPKSSHQCSWDDYECVLDPDEGAFVASIISELRLLGANGNVYLVGNSNGAALAHKLASNSGPGDLPVKGIVTKVTQLLASPHRSGPGVLNYNQPGSGVPPVSVLNVMGMQDGLIPYEGGSSSVFGGDVNFELMGALESMETWATHNGCFAGAPAVTAGITFTTDNDLTGTGATFYEYGGCPDGVIVEHYAIHEAGHSFGRGAALEGIDINHDLAYDFIERVEAGGGGGGGGGGSFSPTAAPIQGVDSSSPTSAPIQSAACENDPDWHGKFNVAHTCVYVADAPSQRCEWESSDGTRASNACKVACETCPTDSPTRAVTSSPTKAPVKVTSDPTKAPVRGATCVDDPDWHGKFNEDHTCDHIAKNPEGRCGWASADGTKASDACKVACSICDVGSNPTDSPIKSTPATGSPSDAPTENPTTRPTLSPVTASPIDSHTAKPTKSPTSSPSSSPMTASPTNSPVEIVTGSPVAGPVDFTDEWMSSYADGDETLIHREVSSIMNYQPVMPLPEDALDPPMNCPHLEPDLLEWSEFSPVSDGNDIQLPPGESVIVRAGQPTSTAEYPYGRILIPAGSRLIFDDTGADGDVIELHTLGITVEGALVAGSPTCRLEGRVEITLHGEVGNPLGAPSERHLSGMAASDMGLKGIVVSDILSARFDFHGTLYHPTWIRLAAPVPGSVLPSAPSVRNSEIFLQDCVSWPDLGRIVVTTSHVKDTRGYNFNEEAVIAPGGVACVTVDGRQYGKVKLTSPLQHYHHAGESEYQCEVGLLSRNIVIQGNDRSDPTDDSPLECDATANGWSTMPCPDTFLTGFGGHTIVVGRAEGRLRGVEFRKMGMTNVMGRYPVHFHHQVPEAGAVSAVTDCSVHGSYFRAITLHDAFDVTVQRNTAYDISGHAYYLESGVEERNRVEYNLAAFVHPINGAQLMASNVVGNKFQSDTILVPADHTASGFYISNVHNYVVGNAASGGWSGIQFPVLPQPADKTLRFNGVVPKDRPSLLITGNSIHSSSWFAANSGAMYEGGSLYWDEGDVESQTLIYNAGRVSSSRLTRYTKDENGNDDWFRVYNTTVWLVNIGATGWGKRAEINGLEVSDFQNRAVFVLFTVWMNSIVINCRTSNAPLVPDPGNGSKEGLLNDGRKWSGFFTYDHLMNHILTNWRVSNCGGVARGLDPWVEGGAADTGDAGLVTIPVNGLAPEVQLISKGMQFDWPSVGGQDFVKESIFFAASGSNDIYSMQYQSNWEDADGSWTNRKVNTGISTVMGPARAGAWWHLDFRPGKCENRNGWKFPQQLCDKDERKLASMFTVVMPQSGQQGSAVFGTIYPNGNARKTRQGSMTHFGLLGDSSLTTCTPPATCGDTTSRSWDPDLTGPFNHAQYGGWYLSFDEGTPVHLSIMKIQMEEGATMIQAMSLPPGTPAGDIRIWAQSQSRAHSFILASSMDEVRNSVDKYFLDESTNMLFWRVIAGYVHSDSSYGWIGSSSLSHFTREGLTVTDTTSKNQIQIHIEISCPTDSTGAFCASKPEFIVPDMGCPEGEVMVAIDQCGLPCELLEEGCPTPSPTTPPTHTCVLCSDDATPWMITKEYECATAPNWLINSKCNTASFWVDNNYCEMRCQSAGLGYHEANCCSSNI